MKSTNQMILELLNEIITDDVGVGFWQLEYILQLIMENPESINNFKRDIYPYAAEKFKSKPKNIEKNISRLIPLINTTKLSEIIGKKITVETLTVGKLVKYIIIYLKLSVYIQS